MATTNYTTLLGLALPTSGDLDGTWGDEVNDAITSLLDDAVAGTTPLSTDADVTLTTTDGAANEARRAVLLCTGARTGVKNITAPAASKAYIVINSTTGGHAVVVRGAGPTTGVSIAAGTAALVAWDGSDFVKIGSTVSYADTTANFTGTLQNGGSNVLVDSDLGSTVQAYDADTAKLDVDQTWSGAQRGTVTSDNDGSFDQSATNNFSCTPTGNVTLTFTNHTAGQSGFILFDNSGAYTGHSLAATTKADSTFLTTINTTGVFLIAYFDNGTNAYVTTTGALA